LKEEKMKTFQQHVSYEQIAKFVAELVFCYQKENPSAEQNAAVNRILRDEIADASEITVDADSTIAFNCNGSAPRSELTIDFYANGQQHKLILTSDS
jgi:hypothetical protein